MVEGQQYTLIITILLFLSVFVTPQPDFVRYDSDCPSACIQHNSSCVIEELNPDSFTKMCYKDETLCENQASQMAVCLRPNGKPFGGSESEWISYRTKYYSDPSPRPSGATARDWIFAS